MKGFIGVGLTIAVGLLSLTCGCSMRAQYKQDKDIQYNRRSVDKIAAVVTLHNADTTMRDHLNRIIAREGIHFDGEIKALWVEINKLYSVTNQLLEVSHEPAKSKGGKK